MYRNNSNKKGNRFSPFINVMKDKQYTMNKKQTLQQQNEQGMRGKNELNYALNIESEITFL